MSYCMFIESYTIMYKYSVYILILAILDIVISVLVYNLCSWVHFAAGEVNGNNVSKRPFKENFIVLPRFVTF